MCVEQKTQQRAEKQSVALAVWLLQSQPENVM